MPRTRSHALALATLAAAVVVAAWIGLSGRTDQPVRTKPCGGAGSESDVASSPAESSEHGVRLQGRPEALEAREVSRAGTTSPGTRPPPPADPWLPGSEPPLPIISTPEPVGIGPFPSAGISATGELVFGQATWGTATIPEGYKLVCYHIGALAPTPPRLLPALRGIPDESPEPHAEHDPWWAELAEALMDAVGRDRWPALDTLLAWDSEQAELYVQQDAEGHSQVTDLLTRRAAGRLGTVQLLLEVEATPAEPADRLTLDVPWGRAVRAHRGSAWAYVGDYDLEVAQGAFFVVPLVLPLDTGLGISVRRIEEGAGLGALDVDVTASFGHPRFDRFETTLPFSYAPVTIELPRLGVARWRGRIPAEPGKHRVELDDGRVVTLVVQASQPGPRPDPAFVAPFLTPWGLRPFPPNARLPERVVVTWLAPGPLQGRTMTIPLVGYGDLHFGSPATGTCTVDSQGRTVDPYRECPWPLAIGGVRIHVAALIAAGISVVDMVVERCDPASDERESAPFLRQDWTHGGYRTWYETVLLPICRVRMDTRRLYLPVGEEASVHLDGDTGDTFRVALPREE